MRKISWQWCTGSERRDRKENEDRGWSGEVRLADGTKACVAAVSDGVGGAVHGAEVAAMAIEALKIALKKAFRGTFQREDLFRAWCDGLTGRLVADLAKTYPDGGATLSVVIRAGRHVAVAWVGDSPIWRVGRERVERWFKPHTKAQELLDAGVDEEDIPPRAYSSLMKSISADEGDGKGLLDCQIHIGNVASWLVVGSDGVFNHIGGSELREIAETGGKRGAAGIMRALLAKSLKNGRAGGKPLDNATASVLSWNHRRPVFGTPTMWVPDLPEGGDKHAASSRRLRYVCIALLMLLVGLGLVFAWKLVGRQGDGAVQKNGRIPGMSSSPSDGLGGQQQQEQPVATQDGEEQNHEDEASQTDPVDGSKTVLPTDPSSPDSPKITESRPQIYTNNSPWPVAFTDWRTTNIVERGGTIATNWSPVGAKPGKQVGEAWGLVEVQSPMVELRYSANGIQFIPPQGVRTTPKKLEGGVTVVRFPLSNTWTDKTDEWIQNTIQKCLSNRPGFSEPNFVWDEERFVAGRTKVLVCDAAPLLAAPASVHTNNSPWTVAFSDGTTTNHVPPGGTIGTNWIPVGAELGNTFGGGDARIRGLNLRTVQPPTVELSFSENHEFRSQLKQIPWQTTRTGSRHAQLPETAMKYQASQWKAILENCVHLKSGLNRDDYEISAHWSAEEFVAGMTNMLTVTATRKPDVVSELKNESDYVIWVDNEELKAWDTITPASWPPKLLTVQDDHVKQWVCRIVPPSVVSTHKGATNIYTVAVTENPKPIIVVRNSGELPVFFDWNGSKRTVAAHGSLSLESDGKSHDFEFHADTNDSTFADYWVAYEWEHQDVTAAPKYGETQTIEVAMTPTHSAGDDSFAARNPETVIELRLGGGSKFTTNNLVQVQSSEADEGGTIVRLSVQPRGMGIEKSAPGSLRRAIEEKIGFDSGLERKDFEMIWSPSGHFELGATNVLIVNPNQGAGGGNGTSASILQD